MMWIRIQTNDHRVRKKLRNLLVTVIRRKDFVVGAGQEVLAKSADRFRCAQNGSINPRLVKSHERAISFLHFDNAILDGHAATIQIPERLTMRETASYLFSADG